MKTIPIMCVAMGFFSTACQASNTSVKPSKAPVHASEKTNIIRKVSSPKPEKPKPADQCNRPKYTKETFSKPGVKFVDAKPGIKYEPYENFGVYLQLFSRYSHDYKGQDTRWLRARGFLRQRRRIDNCLKRYVLLELSGDTYAFSFDLKNNSDAFFHIKDGIYIKMNYDHLELFWRHSALSFKKINQTFKRFGVQVWHEKEGLLLQHQYKFQLPFKSKATSTNKATLKDDIALCKFRLSNKVTECRYKTSRGFSLD